MATTTIELNKLPIQKSYSLLQGDGISEPYHLKIKAEAATTYSNLSLTGCTLKLYVKKGSTTVVNGTSITPDNAASGQFTLAIAGATTASWVGDHVYEVECTFPTSHPTFTAGLIKTIVAGKITVRTDI